MINVRKAKEKCCEPIENIEGYAEAVADTKHVWCCHHKLGIRDGVTVTDELIANDMYYHRPANELIFVTPSQHAKLHPEGRSKGAKAMNAKLTHEHYVKAAKNGAKNQPREVRVSNGKKALGMLFWNNGIINTRAKECPGPDWKRGMLKRS